MSSPRACTDHFASASEPGICPSATSSKNTAAAGPRWLGTSLLGVLGGLCTAALEDVVILVVFILRRDRQNPRPPQHWQ
ncbi:hypothetical protein KL864_34625 [Mycolicibacterium goodii]|uniref:hypothetical protein n=1 Tax=Mycolicibacterium goodii TaxID=134601 RepID=UPI001BDD0E18|nr:hypothetical protein [Mycolicibacterium goodii]MBU8820998.1 hypothetical protein [Mycolicibacterium goodii]